MISFGQTVTAVAHPNIAFIKYWGDRDPELRLPANPSLSMNLSGLTSRTQVTFEESLRTDELILGGESASGEPLGRVASFLDRVRALAGVSAYARIESENNFPTGAGIASSASAFAALALAASTAAGLELDEPALSRLARTGSGSACRSIPGGYVEWQMGAGDSDSYAFSIAAPEYWNLVDCIAVISTEHKPVGSARGHQTAGTSPLQPARIAAAPERLELCRRAIMEHDFDAFSSLVELDSNMMHAVMLTSAPPLIYWQPATLTIINTVVELRAAGIPACYTIDAGPNVHVICPSASSEQVQAALIDIPGVQKLLTAAPGGPAVRVD